MNVRADKKLGQHWLADADAIRSIIESADIGPADTVVEVGPGTGALTTGLCAKAGRVIAIELDRKVLAELEKNTRDCQNLEIRQGDVLKLELAELPKPYKLVGNLPYYITSALLKHFLETDHRPTDLTVTIQAEVAERIVAEPPKMSILPVSVQLYGIPEIVGRIPRQAFRPPPEVDSAILRVNGLEADVPTKLGGLSEEDFFRVVRAGFSEKRKQLHNSLAHQLDLSHEESVELLNRVVIDPSRRAETLTIGEWVQLGHAHQAAHRLRAGTRRDE